MRKKISIFLMLLFCLLLPALLVKADTADNLDSYVQKLFTAAEGLPATAATAIEQTADGFIWIGGYTGLSRYDGRTFDQYDFHQVRGVMDLAAGEDGELWIASRGNGLIYYKDGEFTNVTEGLGERLQSIQCLERLQDGTIYFGTTRGIGLVPPGGEPQMLDIPQLEETLIRRITYVSEGQILLVSRSGELFSFDGTNCSLVDLGQKETTVRCVSYDAARDKLLIGSDTDVIVECGTDFSSPIHYSVYGAQGINDILIDEDSVQWLCSDDGVAYFRDGQVRFQKMKMDNSVDKAMLDQEGNYWFISSRQGVLEVSKSRFQNISQNAGLDGIVINALCKIGGRLFVGYDEGILTLNAYTYRKLDDSAFRSLRDVRIRDLKADGEGNLWVATNGKGLMCYREKDREWISYSSKDYPLLASDKFRCIFDAGSRILAGSDKGAYFIQDGEVTSVLEDPEQMSQRVLCAVQQEDGLISLGTDGYGLYQIKDGQIIRHVTQEEGLSSNVIMKLCPARDRAGLWMVTGDELAFLSQDGEMRNIDAFPTINNLDMVITEEGDVLIMAGASIFRTTEKSLLEDDEIELTRYSYEDGMVYEVTPNSNQYYGDGVLYICGSGGVSSLELDFTEDEQGLYPLHIDNVRIDGKTKYVKEGQPLVLDPGANRLEIDTRLLTFTTFSPDVYYYLEGFDKEPTEDKLASIGAASYTNLNGGLYTFHFGVKDGKTGETTQEILLPIQKIKNWYERRSIQAGLILLGILAASLLTWHFVRRKNRRMERAIKEEFERQEKQHLREVAYKDYLTGLYNRNYMDVWRETIQPAAPGPITCITIDCNNLKVVNDSYGHKQGDAMLVAVARLLEEYFSGENDCIIRLGGDEFLILTCGRRKENVEAITRKAQKAFQQQKVNQVSCSFCCGMHTQEKEMFDFEEGLRLSDLAMLQEKARFHGRG